MTTSRQQKRSGRRQPLGLVSANTFLPSRYSATSGGKADPERGDDESSVASSTASRFSYRGIRQKLYKKKRGLLSSIVTGGNRIGGRSATGKSSSAANALFEDAASCEGAFAYKDIENFTPDGGHLIGVPTTREFDEIRSQNDEDPPVSEQESRPPTTLEVVNAQGQAVRCPRGVCNLPSIASPSWSEYGSAILETWGALEKAASLITSPNHNVINDGGNECAIETLAERVFVDAERGSAPTLDLATDSVEDAHQHQEDDYCSMPCSPMDEFVDAENGSASTFDYCPPKDVLWSSNHLDPASNETQVNVPSIEIERNIEAEHPHKRKPTHDQDIDTSNLESVTTMYIAMEDVASSNLIQCFALLTQNNVSWRSPAIIAMTFGSVVILTHIIWVFKTLV
ncbi:hypothetical protein ACHAW5_008021 [Stephanodiscus triporus]|uniref:Uncharacterized protein n=1 Tax=Stephanodiscus triporus TaxID=2934178 RepID=A0ABD3NNJ4_9STRA